MIIYTLMCHGKNAVGPLDYITAKHLVVLIQQNLFELQPHSPTMFTQAFQLQCLMASGILPCQQEHLHEFTCFSEAAIEVNIP